MESVTIQLSAGCKERLERQAAVRGMTLAELVAKELERIDAQDAETLRILARDDGTLTEEEAMGLAVEEVRRARRGE